MEPRSIARCCGRRSRSRREMFHRIHSIARRERGRKSNSPRERALPGEYRIRKAADPSAQYAGERDAEEPLGNFLTTGCATWEQFARPVTFLSSTVNGYSGRVRPYAMHARARSFFRRNSNGPLSISNSISISISSRSRGRSALAIERCARSITWMRLIRCDSRDRRSSFREEGGIETGRARSEGFARADESSKERDKERKMERDVKSVPF